MPTVESVSRVTWNRLRTVVQAASAAIASEPLHLASLKPASERSLELLALQPTVEALDELEYHLQRIQEFVAKWRPSSSRHPGVLYIQPPWAEGTDRETKEALRLVVELRRSGASVLDSQAETTAANKEPMSTTTGTRSIMFMDVSGWSKLGTFDIKRYVETSLPLLKPSFQHSDFLNTWGDAIVATFVSARHAAEAALKVRDFFTQATLEQGVPEGLLCRIALHQGEVLLCSNALTNGQDIFGHAVHMAARLEPATAPRQVFCTEVFARALDDIRSLGPKAWRLGTIVLPKAFGEVSASVVTWPNEADPTHALGTYVSKTAVPPSE